MLFSNSKHPDKDKPVTKEAEKAPTKTATKEEPKAAVTSLGETKNRPCSLFQLLPFEDFIFLSIFIA